MFESGDKEVKSASELFNEELYGRLARKLRRQSEEREYQTEKLYHGQALYRDANHKGISCEVSGRKQHQSGFFYYQFIKLGDRVFEVAKIDGYQGHVMYRLTDALQLALIPEQP